MQSLATMIHSEAKWQSRLKVMESTLGTNIDIGTETVTQLVVEANVWKKGKGKMEFSMFKGLLPEEVIL